MGFWNQYKKAGRQLAIPGRNCDLYVIKQQLLEVSLRPNSSLYASLLEC